MSWYVKCQKEQLTIEMGSSGCYRILGTGKSIVSDASNETGSEGIKYLESSATIWSFVSVEDEEYKYDPMGDSFLPRLKSGEKPPLVSIKHYESESGEIYITVLLDAASLEKVIHLVELAISEKDIVLGIGVDFLCFKKPGVDGPNPTWSEFMTGKPYISRDYSVRVVNHINGNGSA